MGDDSTDTLRRRARANALMQGAGGVLCVFAVMIPGAVPAGWQRTMYFFIAAACACFCVAALVRRERFGVVAVLGSLAAGDTAIALAASVSNQRPGGNSTLLLLLWPTLLAAVFLPRRLVRIQVVGTALVGVWVFQRAEAGIGVALIQVVVLVTSLAIAATVVVQLRERLTLAVLEQGRLSHTDPLTGLANRRGMEEQLQALWGVAQRRDEHLVALLLDVDRFKRVNDEHGHEVGDEVLNQLAEVVRRHVRSEDVVARYGGEELVVVVADPTGSASDIAERLRADVEEAELRVPVTVSIGAVAHRPSPGEDALEAFTALLRGADGAMYAAKKAGRNRVVVAEESLELLDPA